MGMIRNAIKAMIHPGRAMTVLGTLARTHVDYAKDVGSGFDASVVMGPIQWVQRAFPEARLRLLGDGPLRSALEDLSRRMKLNGNVEFLGARTDIAAQLGEMDMFVYATTPSEGFGIVLAEAMAAGVPIVCTDRGPWTEVLGSRGDAGIIVQHNPQSLAEGMSLLWKDRNLRHRLARTGRILARERYSAVVAARGYEVLLDGQT